MTTTQITISGYVVGPIWWPAGAECFKEFRHDATAYDARCTRPSTLREHCCRITSDGDFQGCDIADGVLTITRHRNGRRVSRDFPLEMFPSISDMLKTDWDGPYYPSED